MSALLDYYGYLNEKPKCYQQSVGLLKENKFGGWWTTESSGQYFRQRKLIAKKHSVRKLIFDTVRIMLNIAAYDNLKLAQYNIMSAILYRNLQENIFMKQAEGLGTFRVCKLKKCLYGLKWAPWRLIERFYKLTIFVDDGLLTATHESLINDFFYILNKEFKTTSTINVKSFLGLEICKLKDYKRCIS